MDPDPAIFVIDLQDASKKLIFNTIFSAYYFLKVHLHHFSKIKSQKESQNKSNQGFSYYFCMMIEGSGSGSIPVTSGSGSGSRRPKNTWIRWIRIRIRNTGRNICLHVHLQRKAGNLNNFRQFTPFGNKIHKIVQYGIYRSFKHFILCMLRFWIQFWEIIFCKHTAHTFVKSIS